MSRLFFHWPSHIASVLEALTSRPETVENKAGLFGSLVTLIQVQKVNQTITISSLQMVLFTALFCVSVL